LEELKPGEANVYNDHN